MPSFLFRPSVIKGVAERGKETNTHFFFFSSSPDPLPPYLPNKVCFFHIYVFGDHIFQHKSMLMALCGLGHVQRTLADVHRSSRTCYIVLLEGLWTCFLVTALQTHGVMIMTVNVNIDE